MKHIDGSKRKPEVRKGKVIPPRWYNSEEVERMRTEEIERWQWKSENCPHGADCFLRM